MASTLVPATKLSFLLTKMLNSSSHLLALLYNIVFDCGTLGGIHVGVFLDSSVSMFCLLHILRPVCMHSIMFTTVVW